MQTPVSLYVHIPFCAHKCPYCSFAVAVGQLHRERPYMDALDLETAGAAGTRVSTVYIGGGTPSCLSPAGTEALFDIIRRRFVIDSGAEVSFEINPEHVDADMARRLRRLGVNRASLGAQSLNAAALQVLGRTHRPEDVRRAFDILRAAGFTNISLDGIYGLPGMPRQDALEDIAGLLAFASEHLSLYALTVEERSLFSVRRVVTDDDAQGGLFTDISRAAEDAGFCQYEVSNFARPGFESRHNINYWEGGEYIGVGMAAHSHISGERSWNTDTLPQYLELMRTNSSARAGAERLPPAKKLVEAFLFALRMARGADLGALEKKFGVEMSADRKEALESFMEMGLLEEEGPFIRATARGRLVLDEISARVI